MRDVDLITILKALAERRPAFHSEADFQHALAWIIHEHHPTAKVRLEYRPARLKRKTYVDIWIEHANEMCAIELKYKTRRLQATVGEEPFDLLDQSAQDIARYDFCKDIGRIEALASAYPGLTGFAVLLTNDQGYWRKSGRDGNVDGAFRVHEAAKLCGRLEWAGHASPGTTNGRTEAICLTGQYPLAWRTYSKCGSVRNSEFRVVVAEIAAVASGSAETTSC
ncbi:MAG: hypothetical protein ACE15C_20345 [Phycisphaerae bacterium]